MIDRIVWRLCLKAWRMMPRSAQDRLMAPGASLSFGLEGEDRVMRTLVTHGSGNLEKGFYVDVGAHHPWLYSNTYVFYLDGWQGINLDPMPGSMEPFQKLRPRDTNLELGVGLKRETLPYYEFKDPAFNGFSEENAKETQESGQCDLVKVHQIETRPLAEILEEHLPKGQAIDFMSVDVEGFDEMVLRSNDWARFRPRFLIVEILDCADWDDLAKSPTARFLGSQGYTLCARTGRSVFFKDSSVERKAG